MDAAPELSREGFLQQFRFRRSNLACGAVDLSEGGVQLRTTERLRPGLRVRILLRMDKIRDEIRGGGEVRWCFQSGKNKKHFYAGIMFRDLEADQAVKISTMRKCFATTLYKSIRESTVKRKGSGPLPRP